MNIPHVPLRPSLLGEITKRRVLSSSFLQGIVRSRNEVRRLDRAGGKAPLIIGHNVLAQVPDLNELVSVMAMLLAEGGVITLEFPHQDRLMEANQLDTIYHERLSYFSLITSERPAARHGLELVDVEDLPTHGGLTCSPSVPHGQ